MIVNRNVNLGVVIMQIVYGNKKTRNQFVFAIKASKVFVRVTQDCDAIQSVILIVVQIPYARVLILVNALKATRDPNKMLLIVIQCVILFVEATKFVSNLIHVNAKEDLQRISWESVSLFAMNLSVKSLKTARAPIPVSGSKDIVK